MDIVNCGGGKILIILSREEVSILSPDGTPDGAARALAPILSSPGVRCGIVLFESKDGGCEIFADRSRDMNYIKTYADKKRPDEIRDNKCLYAFTSLEGALSACRALSLSYEGESALYHGTDSFFLELSSDSPIPGEFGGTPLSGTRPLAVKERGDLLCRDAVGRLSLFAV